MYPQVLVFFCAIALIHLQVVTSENSVQVESVNYAVDITTIDNLHIQIPYYSMKIQTLDAGMRDSIRNVVIESMNYLDNLLKEMLSNPKKKISLLKWLRVFKDLYTILNKVPAKYQKEDSKFAKSCGFNKYIKQVLLQMISKSKEVKNQLVDSKAAKDYAKLEKDTHSTIQGANESLKASPVGIYLAWAQGYMNQTSIDMRGTEIMGRLRYHGYDGLLNTLEKLMKIVLKL